MVIDSLSGFEVALAPAFRDDFRESLYRLVGALKATGVTIFMTTEIAGDYPGGGFTTERVSFITDDIIVQRSVEIEGVLQAVLAIHKMRGSDHSHDFRMYEITANGAVIGGPLKNYRGITTGVPQLELRLSRPTHDGLTERESAVLAMIVRLGMAPRELLDARLGFPPAELTQALGRLESLGYVVPTKDNGSYRAVAHVGG